MTACVIIHSFHRFLGFKVPHLEGLETEACYLTLMLVLFSQGMAGICGKGIALFSTTYLKLKGLIQKSNNPFCQQPASFTLALNKMSRADVVQQ